MTRTAGVDPLGGSTLKTYVVESDVSPSEQLGAGDDELKHLALVFGLHSRASLEQVGTDHPDPATRFRLKKWKRGSAKYRAGAVAHLKALVAPGTLLLGAYTFNERAMRRIGEQVFQELMGAFPSPSSLNDKGKPRVRLGGYQLDGQIVPPYEVLIDELVVIGWYAEALFAAHKRLCEINGVEVRLEVIVDNLPNDLEVDRHRATLLKEILRRGSNGRILLVGVPEKGDASQRDLLVDNVVGLARHLFRGEAPAEWGDGLFGMSRSNLLATDP